MGRGDVLRNSVMAQKIIILFIKSFREVVNQNINIHTRFFSEPDFSQNFKTKFEEGSASVEFYLGCR